MKSDVICLSETWLKKNEELCYLLPPMQFAAASLGPGKGVCVFFRKGHVINSITNDFYCILKVKIETSCVICVYAKSGVNQKQLYNELLPLIVDDKELVMVGDFNFESKDSLFTKMMLKKGLCQLITSSTHDQGHCLDHLYTNQKPCFFSLHNVIYSDHDTILCMLKKQVNILI
jgi:hypothetical protein